ncbi:hypothetical protein H6P81_002295 [Aristolochia fimbriata]|uniref:Uncharacterized protein n=1 Tax=Aristolochia fimbriata TaxID=158543 RepID=A0AAV7FDG3_ARIFI|nr:hypothetical protein H6P81_002295 [Aristolochia fimbriata]
MEEELLSSIEGFEAETRDAERVQRETLEKILKQNEETEYLSKFGPLHGKWDEETFRKRLPLASHRDFEPYIQRIADGDASPILTAKPFTALSWSSGTTAGKPKLVPFNEALIRPFTRCSSTCLAYTMREFSVKEGMFLGFFYVASRHKTKGGLDVAPASTLAFHLATSEKRSNYKDQDQSTMKVRPCSPDEVAVASSYEQALYCHFLCGLLYSDQIQFIRAPFCHYLVQAFRTFESMWKDLCADIREGVLSTERVSDPVVRGSVSKLLLKPNPDLADSVHQKCEVLLSKNWFGLIPQLWPKARFAKAILTGSMVAYVGKLRHYAGDRLPLVSWIYAASEGLIGINARPRSGVESVAYAVCPSSAYFEFIPLRRTGEGGELLTAETGSDDQGLMYEESEPVRLADVRVGETYELVITNFAGLYRYRMGDLVKVSSFYNSTPELQFLRRKNVVLNVRTEKTTEIDLQLAMERASTTLLSMEEESRAEIVDYTSYCDLSTEPGHYVIFWELNGYMGPNKEEVLQKCCDCLDGSFADVAYVNNRKNGLIGDLELRILANGTFTTILEHYQALGSSVNQFKTPRCITSSNPPVLKILQDNVIANFFSMAYA